MYYLGPINYKNCLGSVQKRYDLETPPNVGQFKVNQIRKNKNFILFLWPLYITFYLLGVNLFMGEGGGM